MTHSVAAVTARSRRMPYPPGTVRQLALAALVEREVSDEPGVARGHPDDHAPTAKARTEAPKGGGKCGESHGAEPALPGLHVLTEIKLHVSSGLRVKVSGSAATTAGGVRGRSVLMAVGCQI